MKANLKNEVDTIVNSGEEMIHCIRTEYANRGGDDHYTRLTEAIKQAATSEAMNSYHTELERLQISVAGIHYLKPPPGSLNERWLPILFKEISLDDARPYPERLRALGLDNHLSFISNVKGHPEDYIIGIKDSFFKESSIKELTSIVQHTTDTQLRSIPDVSLNCNVEDHLILRGITDANVLSDIRNFIASDTKRKIITSFFLGFRKGEYSTRPPFVYFYNHPELGGVALSSKQDLVKLGSEDYKKIFRRLILLVGMSDGFLKSLEEPGYKRYQVSSTSLFYGGLIKAVTDYISELQQPINALQGKLDLDNYSNPVFVVERIGNRKSVKKGYRLVVRLRIESEDAFNFLFVDNALLFNKVEEFLNGWITGYLSNNSNNGEIFLENGTKLTQEDHIKARLDVYISPAIKDVEARNKNLYELGDYLYSSEPNGRSLGIEPGSNFDLWNKQILSGTPKTIPAVIYRYSELVGPSIFVGEVAAGIARHYQGCSSCRGIDNPIDSVPIKILDLFSGTGATEATILKRCEGIRADFLAVDINPMLLTSPIFEEVKRYAQIVPVDIFELLLKSQVDSRPREKPNDLYSHGYDIVVADPPHYSDETSSC